MARVKKRKHTSLSEYPRRSEAHRKASYISFYRKLAKIFNCFSLIDVPCIIVLGGAGLSQELLNISLSVDKEELRGLIKKVVSGEWRLYLPQFQRDFEWDEDDIRYFFDSIIRNLPVGSIILWKPARKIEDDPFAVPLIDASEETPYGESFYLLDGQQRLTSLLLLYAGWMISRMGAEISRNVISYVPSQNRLIIGERGGVNLSKLFKGYLDGEFSRVIEPYPRYKEILEKVSRESWNMRYRSTLLRL